MKVVPMQTKAPPATVGTAPIKEQIIHFINKKMPGGLPKKTARALLDIEDKDYVPIIRDPKATTAETEAVFYFPAAARSACSPGRLGHAGHAVARRGANRVAAGLPVLWLPAARRGQFDKAEKMITDNRVLFHRVANTLNYLDIKTVVVSCGTCYDQLQGYKFDEIFPGSRIIDIHEFLLEKGITLANAGSFMFHDPCHSPMKLQEPLKTVKALLGNNVVQSERCCGESGTLALNRPDISTQVRFRKEEEIRKNETTLREKSGLDAKANIKMLTSCPACLQGLSRYGEDLKGGLLEADYIVVEMANQILGEQWMPDYVQRANNGGIERVLV
jgi:Fe-S oxidoreductase